MVPSMRGTGVVLLMISALGLASGACQSSLCTPPAEPGYRYIVPSGFKGCIRIENGVDGGARLPRQAGFAVVDVKRRGQRFSTSDSVGFSSDKLIDEVWVRTDSGLSRAPDVRTDGWTEQEQGQPVETVVCFGGAVRENLSDSLNDTTDEP